MYVLMSTNKKMFIIHTVSILESNNIYYKITKKNVQFNVVELYFTLISLKIEIS